MGTKAERGTYQFGAEDVPNITKGKLRPKTKKDNTSKCQKTKNVDNHKIETNAIVQTSAFMSKFPNSLFLNLNNIHNKFNLSLSEKLKKTVIQNHISRFKAHHALKPFDRRVTSMAWHPKYSEIFVAASKGGELTLHHLNNISSDYICPGIGAGGSIVDLHFDLDDPYTVYTVSITGNIRQEDFRGETSKTLLSTLSLWENWFSCLGICYNRSYLLSGDCTGYGYLFTTSGEMLWNKRVKLHRSKITHCEFNQHDQNIFVTTSVDRSMKLWDLRMIASQSSSSGLVKVKPLCEYCHEKGLNSAYFSPSNGLNLLTTDQHSELRVYSSPFWNESLVIKHPHRHFQHITPIKATWHPMQDIVIVGRYPDINFAGNDTRSIDFYDGSNGKLLHKIASPKYIASLNAMNISGDTLASSAGCSVLFLKDENVLEGVSCHHKSINEEDDDDSPDDTPSKPQNPPKRPKPLPKDKHVSTKTLRKKTV